MDNKRREEEGTMESDGAKEGIKEQNKERRKDGRVESADLSRIKMKLMMM